MIEFRILGSVDLDGPDGEALRPVLAQPKRIALLAYLSVASPRGFHRREKLLGLFWPDSDAEHARGSLRNSLYFLRRYLGNGVIVSRGEEEVRLAAGAILCDAVAFEEALERGDPEKAIELYRGHLLDGFHVSGLPEFERWVESERQRLFDACAGALEKLAEEAEEAREYRRAVDWWKRAISHDPYNSRYALRLMKALAATGDRGNALQFAEEHRRRLSEELGMEPDPDVLALVESLRNAPGREEPSPEKQAVISEIRKREIGSTDAVEALPQLPDESGPRGPVAGPTPIGRQGLLRSKFKRKGVVAAVSTLCAVAMIGGGWVLLGPRLNEPNQPESVASLKSIAVLPFENRSSDPDNAYFAGGLHDELLTQLAKVAALSVRGRTSVIRYAETSKSTSDIAEELDVGALVEGSVQVIDGRLRVNVRLIDAATDEHLWANRYDRTLDDAFAIQGDVAQQIVVAVGAALTRAERRRLAEAPTTNAAAYRFYLQGGTYWDRPGYRKENLEAAQQLFERALALDADFALAHAALSLVHGMIFWISLDRSPARAARQLGEAEAALRLAPNLPEAHVAMGVVHYYRREYRPALEQLEIALQGLPNSAELWTWIGWIHRRAGNWRETAAALDKATELDPGNANVFASLGAEFYGLTHRYADAVRYHNQALSLAPDMHVATMTKGLFYALWQGQLDTMRAGLNSVPFGVEIPGMGPRVFVHLQLLHWDRQADSMLQVLETARDEVFEGQDMFLPAQMYSAWAHQLRGDYPAARAAFDSARAVLDSVIRELPDDMRVHAARGLAYAGLGQHEEAVSEARWLQRSTEYREDASSGAAAREERARILAQIGDAEGALDEIEKLLAGPSWLSVHKLHLDPLWDPLRDHPRFQMLLERYE